MQPSISTKACQKRVRKELGNRKIHPGATGGMPRQSYVSGDAENDVMAACHVEILLIGRI
jgi:hypothetical protein